MQISERKSLVDAALQFRGRGGAATGRFAVDGRFFGNKNTPSLMATKINKNLEKIFCFCSK